ncbi:MAG: hypothetical protein ACHQ5A_02340 [Opitutales bacterium]
MDDTPRLHRFEPGRPHWWQWLTVLSLDAPLVALAWQGAFARALGVDLGWHHRYILGASVWLAYVADRWIEGWRLAPGQIRTQRHWFYQQWRWLIAVPWLIVLTTALQLSLVRLTRSELSAGFLMLAPVLAYLLSHQLLHRESAWRLPKELCVALLFTGGAVCFPAADRFPALAGIATGLLCFGLLCFADCALISLWENEVDQAHGQTSLALQFPQGRPGVRALPWLTALLGVGLAVHAPDGPGSPAGCAAASGVLLGCLDIFHQRIGRQLSRALADLTLLTPFVWWLLR